MTTVEMAERNINCYRRRWLRVARSNVALYSTANTLQLPEEFMVASTREVMFYKTTKDLKAAPTGIVIHTGRKWHVTRELENVKGRRFKALIGTGMKLGRSELGHNKAKEWQHLLQEKLRSASEEN